VPPNRFPETQTGINECNGDIRRAIGRQNKLVPPGRRIPLEKLLVVSSVHDFDFLSLTLLTRCTIP
jgi:hypothetical protein